MKHILFTVPVLCAALAGCGADPTPAPSSAAIQVAPVATGVTTLRDATPDPFLNAIYYASGDGVYRVAPAGGAATRVVSGAPLMAPRGLAFGATSQTLYVADPSASGGGAIFAVRLADGTVTPLAATQGYAPTALDVSVADGAEAVTFTGVDPTSRQPGVFRIGTAMGATVQAVATGAPFVRPDGVYVGAQATYVCDAQGGTGSTGALVVLASGASPRVLAQGFTPGAPCGVSAPQGDGAIMVSSMRTGASASQVLLVDAMTGATRTFDEGIRQNPVAGGLHRARFVDRFAWVGLSAGTAGAVYRVELNGGASSVRTFNGGRCTCGFESVGSCTNAGGSQAFCSACC